LRLQVQYSVKENVASFSCMHASTARHKNY
jgi:hypothetical protein